MWADDTRNAKNRGGVKLIELFTILNGYENIYSNLFSKLSKVK